MKARLTGRVALALVMSVALGFIGAGQASAEVPKLINYQGLLVDDTGVPANGTFSIRYAIYAAEVGGTSLWEETQDVTTQNGIYNVLLGSVTTIPDDLFQDPNRYLGVKIGIDPEMVPRQRFTSVPYAFNSNKAATPNSVFGDLIFLGIGGDGMTTGNHLIPEQYDLTAPYSSSDNAPVTYYTIPDVVPDSATYMYCTVRIWSDGLLGIRVHDSTGRCVNWFRAEFGFGSDHILLPVDAQRKIGFSIGTYIHGTGRTPLPGFWSGHDNYVSILIAGYVLPI